MSQSELLLRKLLYPLRQTLVTVVGVLVGVNEFCVWFDQDESLMVLRLVGIVIVDLSVAVEVVVVLLLAGVQLPPLV